MSEQYNQTTQNIQNIFLDAISPYNDGYVASGCKKELVMLRRAITKLINKCPNYGDLEDEWEKEIMFEILKEK